MEITIVVGFLLILVTVAVIAFPLYFQKLTKHLPENQALEDVSEQDALLSAISELEEEHQLGRISDEDYERLKLHFQRRYIKVKRSATSTT